MGVIRHSAVVVAIGAVVATVAASTAGARDVSAVASTEAAQGVTPARGAARLVIGGRLRGGPATVTVMGVGGPATGQLRRIRVTGPRAVNLPRLPVGRYEVYPTPLIAPGHLLSLGQVSRRSLTVRPVGVALMPIRYVGSTGPAPGSTETVKGVQLTIANDYWPTISAAIVDPYNGLRDTGFTAPEVTLTKGGSRTWRAATFSGDFMSGAKTLCVRLDGTSPGLPFTVCGTNPVIGKPKLQVGVTWLKWWDGGTASTGGFWKWTREWEESFPLSAGQSLTRQLDLDHTGTPDPFPGAQWTFARGADNDRYKTFSITVSPVTSP